VDTTCLKESKRQKQTYKKEKITLSWCSNIVSNIAQGEKAFINTPVMAYGQLG
jgi:hypothetical protein